MYMSLSYSEIVLRLLVSFVIGGLMGIERKKRGKPAGFRTYVLVSLSATGIAIVSAYGFTTAEGVSASDPARLAVGIITGMGFLGAGIIWRSPSGTVQGITTAAHVWATACLGIIIGFGYYFLSIITMGLIMLVLLIKPLYNKLQYRCAERELCEEEQKEKVSQPRDEVL